MGVYLCIYFSTVPYFSGKLLLMWTFLLALLDSFVYNVNHEAS
jgi:hypothetical protein